MFWVGVWVLGCLKWTKKVKMLVIIVKAGNMRRKPPGCQDLIISYSFQMHSKIPALF
uniref:Transcription factor HBP-1bC1 n=1 Tax=Rhizophora mucronata TaxID=61149 RepID=A0A2P2L332_RHIMU